MTPDDAARYGGSFAGSVRQTASCATSFSYGVFPADAEQADGLTAA